LQYCHTTDEIALVRNGEFRSISSRRSMIKGSEVRKAAHEIEPLLLECRENLTPLSPGTALGKLSGLELFVTVWWFAAAARTDGLRRYRDKTTRRVRANW